MMEGVGGVPFPRSGGRLSPAWGELTAGPEMGVRLLSSRMQLNF